MQVFEILGSCPEAVHHQILLILPILGPSLRLLKCNRPAKYRGLRATCFKPFAGRAEKRRVFIPRYLAGLRKMGRKPGKKTRIFGFSMKSLYVLLGNTAILNVCFFSYVQWVALICVDENFGPGRRSRFSFLGGLEADFGPSSDFGDRQSSHLPSGY